MGDDPSQAADSLNHDVLLTSVSNNVFKNSYHNVT
jgi:hypothetical protein